jgi:predicted dehydrogenase
VIGDAGTMVLDFNASTFRVSRRDRPVESRTFEGHERNQLFLDELQHFLACLRGEARPVVPLGDAVQSLRMAMAVKTSMETGAAVTLS